MCAKKKNKPVRSNKSNNTKLTQLADHKEESSGQFLSTNQGVKINDNQNSLKSGERGSTLLEDFILREKIHISIMSVYPSELFMRVVRPHTEFSNSMNR